MGAGPAERFSEGIVEEVLLPVVIGGVEHHVRFAFPAGTAVAAEAEAQLAAGLLPAMRRGEDLRLRGPLSPRLRQGADGVQDVLTTWDRSIHLEGPRFRRVEVHAPGSRPVPAPGGRGTACFFTGGVDSFHSAFRHRHLLDALVYVHGFDVDLGDLELRQRVAARLRTAADQIGVPLLEVETDLQAFGVASGVGWGEYHGAALAAVASLLAPSFQRFLVPATHTYAHLEPLGSHPLLDPLWSSEAMEVVHDGADLDRVQKLAFLAEQPVACEHLRVCWVNTGGAYNCGSCEKCVRTAVAARIAGFEPSFTTLPSPSLVQIARVRATGRGSAWHDLHDELLRSGASPRLRRTIQLVLVRHQLARWSLTKRWFA